MMNKKSFFPRSKFIYLVLLVSVLAHSSYIFNGFTWLDHGDIEAGRSIVSLLNFRDIFLTNFGQTGFYRPVVTILNSFDNLIYSKSAYGFHLTNVILHVAVVYAVYLFSQAYFKLDKNSSLLASLVVGIHPISWLPVGAISYRSEILVTLFSLLFVYFHIRTRRGEMRLASLALLFLLLSFFSKETALVWLPLLIYFWEVGSEKSWVFRLRRLHLLEIGLVISYLILRFAAIPQVWNSQGMDLPVDQALGTRLFVVFKQVGLLVSPFKPALSDATVISPLISWLPLIVLIMIFLMLFMFYKFGLRNIYSRMAMFVIIALIPVSSIIPLPRFSSPHYSYFASVGMAALLAVVYFQFRFKNKKVFNLVLVFWLSLAAVSTFLAGFRFKNDLTLFVPEADRDKNFLEGHFYIADYYLRENDFEKAEERYELASLKNSRIIAYVDRFSTDLNLAGAKLGLGKYGEAEEILLQLLENSRGSRHQQILYNLGLVYWHKADYTRVVATLQSDGKWDSNEPLLLLAKAYIALDMSDKSIEPLRESLQYLSSDKRLEIVALIEEIIKESNN